MSIWKDSLPVEEGKPLKWTYDEGVVLKGIEGLWLKTSDPTYFNYIQNRMDLFVDEKGNIKTYKPEDYNIDNVACGRILLTLYKVTGKEKYFKAASLLRQQLKQQPRLNNGGFWHKKRYPYQMWLDGLYMGEPFYAEWSQSFKEDSSFNDIARQFILMEQVSRDAKTGLMYHGYDESRKEKWASTVTGLSQNFWARAMGWYGMGLVDVLENFPKDHPKRKELIQILNRYAAAIVKVQDRKSGLWWDVLNFPSRKGNYTEASASCMFVYALLKGVRLGYLPTSYYLPAKKGYQSIIATFVRKDNGQIRLEGTVSVSGLGGTPYRDGSYDYYVSEKVVANDPKGVGAFLLASNEYEMLGTLPVGKGKTVLLDSYFNNEYKKDAAGIMQSHHYKWEEQANGGFSFFKYLFNAYGVNTQTLKHAPNKDNLKNAHIYIIVDPDNNKEVRQPNFIDEKDISEIFDWVKNGGVLVLLANDTANVEFPHYNKLAHRFGIHWSDTSRNMVKNNEFETGAIPIPKNHFDFPVSKQNLSERDLFAESESSRQSDCYRRRGCDYGCCESWKRHRVRCWRSMVI